MNPVTLLHDHLLATAKRAPEKPAVTFQGKHVTYGEIDARSNALANALVRRGVARGDRVIVFLDNSVETVIAFWAVLKANAVVSIVHPHTKSDKLAWLLEDCRATALVTGAQLAPVFVAAAQKSRHLRAIVVAGSFDPARHGWHEGAVAWAEALAPERTDLPPTRTSIDVDLASIIYTSGSTGEPKGVMLTHRNMTTACASITQYLGSREDDVVLCALPMSFDYGLYQMIMTFSKGGRLVLEKGFTYPMQVMKTVVEEGVTTFPGVPTMFAMLTETNALRDFDLRHIRTVTNTAAALPVQHILALKELFPAARIYSMYGLTECKRCTYLPPEDLDRKPASVGVAIPNTELWLVDEKDRRVGPNEVGQLVIRGATVMAGYWEKPEQTAKKLRPGPVPGERVLYTGDLCKLDDEGYLYFVGRMDDIIKCRGEKVAPKEIEAVLYGVPGVKEAAVIGVADAVLGQVPKAFVTLEGGASVDERALRQACMERLESFMVPKYFEVVAAMPKSDNGKIDKKALSRRGSESP